MGSKREKSHSKKLIVERRMLFSCTVMIGLCVILWIVAISTDWWFIISGGPNGIYVNETKRLFRHSHSGIWRICRTSYGPVTPGTGPAREKYFCRIHAMFPNDTVIRTDPSIDKTIVNYNRSEASFSIISLVLMIMGLTFSTYTFRNPRYMFKRLAGVLHFISGGSVLAVIEVLINSITYEQNHLPFTFPPGATYSYGFSIVLAWLVFVMLLVSGCVFLIYSRKRKGSKAPNDEIAMADEPTIIGR